MHRSQRLTPLPHHHRLRTTTIPRHRRLSTVPTRRCRRNNWYPIPPPGSDDEAPDDAFAAHYLQPS
eukprot:827097-Pleurochrysis_carterae.AAC.1